MDFQGDGGRIDHFHPALRTLNVPTAQVVGMSEIDQRLQEMSNDLVSKLTCPGCNASLSRTEIVEIVAPDDEEAATKETYKNTVGGAGVGGLVGALGGPVGVVAGAVAGSIFGGTRGAKRGELKRIKVNCPHCQHHGRAL